MNSFRIALIEPSKRRAPALVEAIEAAGCTLAAVLRPQDELGRELAQLKPDAILLDIGRRGEALLHQLRALAPYQVAPVVVLAEDVDSSTLEAVVQSGVSAYLADAVQQRSSLKPVIALAVARFREVSALRSELETTRQKLAERSLIEKAKGLLMRHKGYDEESAYRALRKMAMDHNHKLADVARNVIAVLELGASSRST